MMEVMLDSDKGTQINDQLGSKNEDCSVVGDVERLWPVQRRRGLRAAVRVVERDLWLWHLKQKGKVSKSDVQTHARNTFLNAGIPNFKASDGWYKRWTRRWRASLKEGPSAPSTSCETLVSTIDETDPPDEKHSHIVTPSLGDTLESTFPCLETSRLPCSEQRSENRSVVWDEAKEDTRLTTPQHNSFEQYALAPKALELGYCNGGGDGHTQVPSDACDREEDEKVFRVTSRQENKEELIQEAGGGGGGGPMEGGLRRPQPSQPPLQQVGRRYHSHFKERVLSYLKSHTFKETARKFGVHQGSVSAWHQEKLRLRLTEDRLSRKGGSSLVSEPAPADVQFLSWLRLQRGCRVTPGEVRECACRVVSLAGGLPVVERQVRWFALWVRRLEDRRHANVIGDSAASSAVGEDDRRVQYPASFRTEVAAFAAEFSQMAAVRTFHVSRKRVFEWLRAYQGKSSGKMQCEVAGSGRSVTDPEVDRQVWQWYCDSQDKQLGDGHLPTSKEVCAHAALLYAKRGLSSRVRCSYGWFRRWCKRFGVRLRYSCDEELLAWALAQLDCNRALSHASLQEQAKLQWRERRPDFKASPGWVIRFCKRYPQLLQAVPAVNTPLPGPLRPMVAHFRSCVRDLVHLHSLSPAAVGNMDELPLGFSAPPAGAPKRPLLLRKPGMDCCHATVVLSCSADGSLLPTMLILKDGVDGLDAPQNLVVVQQERGVMDLTCMQKWLRLVWFRYSQKKSVLVADRFDPHCAPQVTSQFGSCEGRWLLHVPAGCSSKLQPLDVAVKGSFQRIIDQRWESLISGSGRNWACGQQLRLPTSQELVQWVADAHNFISRARQETVRRSFLVTGLLLPDDEPSVGHFVENLSALPSEEEDSPEM